MPPDDACSSRSLAAGEPLAGTAVADSRWLLLERPGPWPPKPAGALADRCTALGIRLQLLRRSVARADDDAPRTCFLAAACEDGDGFWVQRHLLREPADVLALPLEELAEGRPPERSARHRDDLYLVCAHGERDPCCAAHGRPLHRALRAARPEQTWQTSHLGGHRFAATMLHLPSGVSLGRVPAARAGEVAETLEAGRIPVDLLRGRVGMPAAAQAAEALVRAERGIDALAAVRVVAVDGDAVTLRVGGEVVDVTVGREPLDEPRPASCGKEPEPADRPVFVGSAVSR